MNGDLRLLNRQRARPVDTRLLRQITLTFLNELLALKTFDLTINLVADRVMAQLNQQHLGHAGSTDVITLDYSERGSGCPAGELFICLDEAASQARRFGTTWPSELVRYIIHGTLHLLGHDDLRPPARRRMKLAENRHLRELSRRFDLRKLARKAKVAR